MIDSVPSSVDIAANGVGMQSPKYEERSKRKGVIGVQCSGRAGLNRSEMYDKPMILPVLESSLE